jgi:hypothetical protein
VAAGRVYELRRPRLQSNAPDYRLGRRVS